MEPGEKDVRQLKRGNTISIKGNATRDIEIRRTASGMNACSWSIAWNDSRKGANGNWEDVPHFFDVECWASDAQVKFLQGLRKGARCAIIGGHLEQQRWERNGQKYTKVIIRADDPVSGVLFDMPQSAPIEVTPTILDDSIPF